MTERLQCIRDICSHCRGLIEGVNITPERRPEIRKDLPDGQFYHRHEEHGLWLYCYATPIRVRAEKHS